MAPILSILPVQIVFQIISFLDDRHDLLSLAQTCRVLSQVIIPDYIDHMEIHSPPHMTEIWNDLLERPVLAQCIKTLSLMHSMNERLALPPEYRTLTHEFARKLNGGKYWCDERALVSLRTLFTKLENLTCFRVVSLSSLSDGVLFGLLEALNASGCSLEKLEIALYHATYFNLFIPNLSSLTGLSLSVQFCPDIDTRSIIEVLIKSPCLVQLKLCMPVCERFAQILRSLFTLHWPMLKHLTIEQPNNSNDIIGIEDLYIINFLTRHTILETLYYQDMLPPGCFPPHSTLRSLHYVSRCKLGEPIPSLGDIIPKFMARHLVHLSVSGAVNPKLGIGKNEVPLLESCVLPSLKPDSSFSFISELVAAAPNLQKCSVNIGPCEPTPILEILRLFKHSRNLSHLLRLFCRTHFTTLSTQQHFIDALNDLPSLVYIDAFTPQGKPCIRLLRHPNLDFETIPFHVSYRVSHLKSNQWGCFFQSFGHRLGSSMDV